MQLCYNYAWSTKCCWINNILIFLLSVSFVCTLLGLCCVSDKLWQVPHCGDRSVCDGKGQHTWLCEDSVTHFRFFSVVFWCGLSQCSYLVDFSLCFLVLQSCIFSVSNFPHVCAVSRLWKWRWSWAGVQDGDHTTVNPAKQRSHPSATATEETRTGGDWKRLR